MDCRVVFILLSAATCGALQVQDATPPENLGSKSNVFATISESGVVAELVSALKATPNMVASISETGAIELQSSSPRMAKHGHLSKGRGRRHCKTARCRRRAKQAIAAGAWKKSAGAQPSAAAVQVMLEQKSAAEMTKLNERNSVLEKQEAKQEAKLSKEEADGKELKRYLFALRDRARQRAAEQDAKKKKEQEAKKKKQRPLQPHKGLSCEELKNFPSGSGLVDTPLKPRIPKHLVLTGKPESFNDVVPELRNNIQKILKEERTMSLRYLGDDACRKYIQEHYSKGTAYAGTLHGLPTQNLTKYYKNEKLGAFRGDICRAAVLFREGGYYIDLEVELHQPLSKLVDKDTGFMTAYSFLNPEVSKLPNMYGGSLLNAIMAAEPRSPVLAATLFEINSWYTGDPSIPWSHMGGVIHMGPLSLWRGLSQVMHCTCPDAKDLNGLWKDVTGESTSMAAVQWPCADQSIRLYHEKKLNCEEGKVSLECPESRAKSSFAGVKYGIFNPGAGGSLIAWPRLAACTAYGCNTGGHDVSLSVEKNKKKKKNEEGHDVAKVAPKRK